MMIVLRAHARNFAGTSQPVHRETCAKKRHSGKNRNVDDWLAAGCGGRIDVLDGNR